MNLVRKFAILAGSAFLLFLSSSCHSGSQADATQSTQSASLSAQAEGDEIIHISASEFRKQIFDYQASPNKFVYKDQTPAIIDFYADWCGPCRKLSPKLEAVAKKYKGKLKVYKVNVDKEMELARAFNVQSIPMCLFVPVKGSPIQTMGNLSEEDIEKTISQIL